MATEPTPVRLVQELRKVAGFLYEQGIGDGANAVEGAIHAVNERDRLAAENEGLREELRIAGFAPGGERV